MKKQNKNRKKTNMKEIDLLQITIKALTIFNANDTMLSVDSCADFLDVHPNTIKNRIQKGTIKAIFQDGKYHIAKIQFLERIIALFEESNLNTAE